MGFAERAESWRAKAHLTGVRLPVLVGVTALAAIVLIAAGGALVKAGTSDGFSLSRDDGAATSDGTDEDGAASVEARTVFVHVGGAVVEPGVRELAEGARVQDAVDAAGGFADGAARDALNLARVLADGEQIVVPSQEEAVLEPGAAVDGGDAGSRAAASPTGGKIDLNRATAAELDALPGVGPSTAETIVADREANGPFRTVEDLKRVSASGTRSSPIWPISYARRRELRGANRSRFLRARRCRLCWPARSRCGHRARRCWPHPDPGMPAHASPSARPASSRASHALSRYGGCRCRPRGPRCWEPRSASRSQAGARPRSTRRSCKATAFRDAGDSKSQPTVRRGPYGATCFARANLPDIGAVTVRLRFEEGEDPPRYGDVLDADATLSAPGGSSAAYCWRQGAVLEGTARRVVSCERADALGILTGLRNRAIDLIADEGTDDGAAVLAALVCGWRRGGDVRRLPDQRACAIPWRCRGAPVSIVAGCAAALLRALRVPRRAGAVLQASFLLGFLVLAAAPSSAVRAAVMAFAGMFAFTARRRPAALSALAVCMIGCIALDPRTALAVSFALSALSTLGIVLFAGLFQAWIAQCFQRAPRLAREALSLTAASSLAAAPLAASLFSQVPVVAPLANVAAAPLFPVVCAGGFAAVLASLAVPAVAPALIGFASMGTGALTAVVRALASVPYASLPASVPLAGALLASAACAAALWLAWPRPSRRRAFGLVAAAACVMIGTVVVAPRLSGDEIVMLDVGQGDAFLVRSRGTAVLIDTGNQDRMLREALARHGAYRLDAVVITHGDDDHKGSLASLAGVVDVRRVLVAQDALSCGCEACVSLVADARKLAGDGGVVGLRQGDALQVGSFDLQTVWPERFSDEGATLTAQALSPMRTSTATAHPSGVRFSRETSATSCARSSTKGLWTPSTSTRWAITDPRTPSTTRRPPSFLLASRWSAQGRATATAIRRRTRSIGSRPRAHASSAPTSREMSRAN